MLIFIELIDMVSNKISALPLYKNSILKNTKNKSVKKIFPILSWRIKKKQEKNTE
jgi:hypothetical protein